jgi:hypothetical protein
VPAQAAHWAWPEGGDHQSLVYIIYLERSGSSEGVQWLAGLLLLVGVLAQLGGFFLHLGVGQQLDRDGADQVRGAADRRGLVILAVGLI